ncbi:MAG: hypothetical protein RIE03_18770, partial [Pseudomonadales bacterium]
MAFNQNPMPPEGAPPPPPEQEAAPPAPEPEGNPWESWQQAGLDPTAFDPHEVRNAANFFQALKNPDQRQYALSYLANQLRPEERQQFFADQQAADEPDPYFGDPGADEYGYEGQPSGMTPEQVQQIVQQQMSE